MTLNTHLVNGQCQAAFKVYERCLGGKITFMLTWGDSPIADQAPAEWRNKDPSCDGLTVGDNLLTGCDVFPDQYEPPKGFSVMLHRNDPSDAERVFGALAENGTVRIPLQKTFWAARFGELVD